MYWFQKLMFATISTSKYKIYKTDSASIILFMLVYILCCFRSQNFLCPLVSSLFVKIFRLLLHDLLPSWYWFFFSLNPPPPHSLSTEPIIFKKKIVWQFVIGLYHFLLNAYILYNVSKSRLSDLQCMCVWKGLEQDYLLVTHGQVLFVLAKSGMCGLRGKFECSAGS